MSFLELREPTTGPKDPLPEEMAAIAAAVEHLWPGPSVEQEVAQTAESVWKFANRWWGANVANRARPRRPSAF